MSQYTAGSKAIHNLVLFREDVHASRSVFIGEFVVFDVFQAIDSRLQQFSN